MFGHEKTPPRDPFFPDEKKASSESVKSAPSSEEKRPKPRPLANPEAMPQNFMKYEKPSPKTEKIERERIVPVLKSLANTEAMPGPKRVEQRIEQKKENLAEKKDVEKEDLFLKLFKEKEEKKAEQKKDFETVLGKIEPEEDDAPEEIEINPSVPDTPQKIEVKKYILKRIKKPQEEISSDLSAQNNTAAEEISSPEEENQSEEEKKDSPSFEKESILSCTSEDLTRPHSDKEEEIKKSLDGMYGVFEDPNKRAKKTLTKRNMVRYAVLFLCIFGFFTAGAFVFGKLYEYYRSYVVYSGLQELVEEKDFFHEEYLPKSASSVITLTPQDILSGKKETDSNSSGTFTEDQQNLVGKIGQLQKINPDTAGWITIGGTVVNYPLVWSETKNYYLRRDFYGKVLSSGTIYIDERNSPNIAENRNTVIYGHNMKDGSMFASIHDFANASVFYGATIEIATAEGIFVYKPFSAHESDAYDNYFETDFVSDDDFINFCEQMAFISIFQADCEFDKNSQIITLSTCINDERSKDGRFAVHAILVKVIR